MHAHIACRPAVDLSGDAGCYLVCPEHGLKQSFGFTHKAARAAVLEHNLAFHAA